MNITVMWEAAQRAAAEIVQRHRAMTPPGVDVQNSTKGEVDTGFSRSGTTGSTGGFSSLPPEVISLMTQALGGTAPGSNMTGQGSNFLSGLFTRSPSAVPGGSVLSSNMAVNPSKFEGSPSLSSMSARDPYSSAFETSTQAAYEQRAGDALAQAVTGPDSVRGGQTRSGIAQGVTSDRLAQGRGQEVRSAQVQDAGIVQGASNLFNQIETARRGVQLGAQGNLGQQSIARDSQGVQGTASGSQMFGTHGDFLSNAARLLGTQYSTTTEALGGKGHQASNQRSFLPGCCFIFLEALNGTLPWYIEEARRDYYTPRRERGYKWMSKWLVPAMASTPWVKHLVNNVIIRPFLAYGRWRYTADNYDCVAGLLWPYCLTWLTLWGTIGLFVKGEYNADPTTSR